MIKPIVCDYSIEGRGQPLFLIHGIGAARDAWRFLIPKLSEYFTVISYDLRGHGLSPKPSYEFDLNVQISHKSNNLKEIEKSIEKL